MEDKTLRHMLETFQQRRNDELSGSENKRLKLHDLFEPIANRLLCGGYFEVCCGKDVVRRVFPYTVEFYYHEESGAGEVKDWIVYHRNPDNPKKDPVPPFVINSINTHVSGIDITFEGLTPQKAVFRASALIRAFQVIDGAEGFPAGEGEPKPEVNRFSTHLYNNLFMGIDIEKGINVKWTNRKWASVGNIHTGYRYNVCNYKTVTPSKSGEWERHVKLTKKDDPTLTPGQIQDTSPWAFSRGEFTGECKF